MSTRQAHALSGLVLAAALCGAAAPLLPDLDVAVPPGSPLDWARSFPALTPAGGPLFPSTPPSQEEPPGRTRVPTERPRLDVRFSSSFDLTRILTFDIVAELDWVETRPRPRAVSGRSSALPPEPRAGDPLYWTSLVALLRLALHPSETPRSEIEVHLIEIGEAVSPVLEAARNQPYLQRTTALVAERVAARDDRAAGPIEQGDAYERMLRRFVYEELRAEHPCDPAGSFGRRMFLFSEELEPYLREYATHGNAYLRRAAVAALGRYRTRTAVEALVGIAVTSADPVAMTRALAGLGRANLLIDAAPLVARLDATGDLHERTALVGALGRLEATKAVPVIVGAGRDALQLADSDLLVTVLSALARIPAGRHADEVRGLLDAVQEACRTRPGGLGPSGGAAPVKADRPDDPRQRVELLEQLAQIARARLAPLEPELQREVLGWLSAEPPRDPRAPGATWLNAVALTRVQAPARFVLLDLLGRMEDAGTGPLARTAADPGQDVALRGHALARLPWTARLAETSRLLAASPEPMRIQALHLAERDGHPELESFARAELARGVEQLPGLGSPEQRYLVLSALRALGARNRLEARDVLPLLFHAQAPQHAFGDLPERVRDGVDALIAQAASGLGRSSLTREARALVDLVVEKGLRAELRNRAALASEVAARLAGAAARKSDAVALELLSRDVQELLLGYPLPRWSRERAEFQAPVPLEEEILLALGRTREPIAVEALVRFLENRHSRLRALACLALGMTDDAGTAGHLAPYLVDPEPFTRWCAYLALNHLTGVTERIDWMYAPEPERYAAAQRIWKQLLEPR